MITERLTEDLITLTRILRPARRPDMTPEQMWLLRHLRCSDPLSMSDLARALGITVGSVTVACKRLEKVGLVTRERQTADERIVHVTLTEQGRALIDEWRQQRREALAKLLSVLDEHEQEDLLGLVERLLAAAEEQGFQGKRKHDKNH